MHEFSAALSIVETAAQTAKANKVLSVKVVTVEVGDFTFLVPEQLAFNFEIASKNSVVEGAKLQIKRKKGVLRCIDCDFEGESQVDPDIPPQIAVFSPMKCPKCKGSSTEIIGGKEFIVTNIIAEIE